MDMQVFNSLTRRVEPLAPLADNTIRLYTCGPTVYNFAHIGNFRATRSRTSSAAWCSSTA